MGIFSIYTGLLYNDIFSRTLHLFHSGWDFPEAVGDEPVVGNYTGHVYPFGLDPAWHGASNALVFTNSYKMKMSIVLGVMHMTFALCLQVPNHIRFNRRSEIWSNFLPQMLFLQSIFGYLVLCILYKWSVDWDKSPTQAPSLLNMLIDMFLKPGVVDPSTQLYRGQSVVQTVLTGIAGICVPWMLIVKPYILYQETKRIKGQGYVGLDHDDHGQALPRQSGDLEGEEEGHGRVIAEEMEEEGEHHDFSEIVIEQIIHTIEFCLGCISHTASYLRLWALSLAHAQLSEVLWNMTLARVLDATGLFGWINFVLILALWFNLTVGILCVMEVSGDRPHMVPLGSRRYRETRRQSIGCSLMVDSLRASRVYRHSCTHYVCIGWNPTVSTTNPVDT